MGYEKPNLHFDKVVPVEVVAPRGLEPSNIEALFVSYPNRELNLLFAERELQLKQSVQWAREACATLLPSDQSEIATVTGYDDPHTKHWQYVEYSTSENVFSTLYALAPYFGRDERVPGQEISTRKSLGEAALGSAQTNAHDSSLLKLFTKKQRAFEKRRSEAVDTLAAAEQEFHASSKKIYLAGVPDGIPFTDLSIARYKPGLINIPRQYMNYFGKNAIWNGGDLWGLLKTAATLPKLLPLITNSEEGIEMIDHLAERSVIVAKDRGLSPDYRRPHDVYFVNKDSPDVKEHLRTLLTMGYEQFQRSFPPTITGDDR